MDWRFNQFNSLLLGLTNTTQSSLSKINFFKANAGLFRKLNKRNATLFPATAKKCSGFL